ncbi:MAG: toprim domain-containing protein [Mycobacteriales bacterium]
MIGSAYEHVLDVLAERGSKVKASGSTAIAQCPAHRDRDRDPSLSVRAIEGSVLLKCHAGCDNADVLAAIGCTLRDLYDNPKGATYTYDDGRIVHRTPDKRFRQSGNTKGAGQLYRLWRVIEAVADDRVVYVVEGEKDVLALESIGAVATCSPMGAGKWARVDSSPLHGASVVVVADRDAPGDRHARDVVESLTGKAKSVSVVQARAGKDAADHIAAGYTLEDLVDLDLERPRRDTPTVEPVCLDDARTVFRRWLGQDYDTDALDAMLAAVAVEQMDGDPLWLLIISGSGNAKTETVQALSGVGAAVVSTISSEGALLSATSRRERTRDATGGLLREIGDHGVLVVKDVTSILSMNRDMRGQVLGALREVHDGSWTRKVGTDGGKSLSWAGRVAVIGAVTTAWDQAHAVISSMGDRFVLLRMDSSTGRRVAGRKAIGNTGHEEQMRAELAAAIAGVIAGMDTEPMHVNQSETEVLLSAADLVTLARTGVEYDYRGDVIDAHAPEMPTRFAKELTQVVRGSVAVGMGRRDALRLAIRCARDSMPPLRLAIVDDLAANPDGSTTVDVRKRLGKPRSTVDRQLQALHMLGVIACDEEETEWAGKPATRWHYRLADGIDPTALDPKSVPEMSVPTPNPSRRRETTTETSRLPTDKSGTDSSSPSCRVCGQNLLLAIAGRNLCARCERAIES